MAKKKLLNEAQVRRFMSLSGIQPLKEMYGKKEEEMNEMGYKMEEDEMEEAIYEEEGAEEPMDEPMDEPAAEEPMGDEEGMDEPAEEPAGDEEEELLEALEGVDLQLSNNELVQEVTRRVAKRIMKAKRAQQQLDEALGNKKPRRKK
mgnify:CR=1 FL=1